MNSIVAGIMGLTEDDSVPVPSVRPRQPKRSRDSLRPANRRMIAAIMGMAEDQDDDESVIPDDAEELKNVMGPSGIKMDGDAVENDREPDDPNVPSYGDGDKEQLMSPAVALVAPDVTPDALKPLDPSQVPQPAAPAAPAAPPPSPAPAVEPDAALRVLLGKDPKERPDMPPIAPITAEAAQASVNASLGVSAGNGLQPGQSMPEHQAGQPAKIMEAFYRYGNVRNSWR